MRNFIITIYVLLLGSVSSPSFAQDSGEFIISTDSVALTGLWKYHSGDDSSWADPEFDDSGWEVKPTAISDTEALSVWTGNGWFRAHLIVDSSLLNYPLVLIVHLAGASEIYLNGKLLHSIGKVGVSQETEKIVILEFANTPVILFNKASDNVIAVRFSNHRIEKIIKEKGVIGFEASLIRPGVFFPWHNKMGILIKRYQMFFTSAALAIALLHIFLFVFYPRAKENLYFAVFAISIVGLAYAPYARSFAESYRYHLFVIWLFKISMILTAVAGTRFLYYIFYNKIPRQFWLILAASIVMMLLGGKLNVGAFYLFLMFPLMEILRVVIVAVFRKKPGSRVIAVGFAAFVLLSMVQMVEDILRFQPAMDNEFLMFAYLYGILFLLISMSIYLARNFALTSKNLELKLVQVKELSEKTLEQERNAKKQQMKQVILETEISHRKKELKEAKKLSKALTDLEKAHAELKNTQTQLVQSEKMASLGMLVAGIAHEINTPVGAVSSMHDTLMRAIEKLKKTLETEPSLDVNTNNELQSLFKIIGDANKVIDTGATRVNKIVKRLRSFARLDEAELKKIDIHEGLEDTLTLIHHEIKHKADIIKKFGDIRAIACFPGQLNQVFLNLLVNSTQAIKDKGDITITTKRVDDKIKITFEDTGAGISPENLRKIFDPGFTTKGVGIGTGLGLSICYQIIQDHHGEIMAESTLGEGAKFTIILPTNLDEIINSEIE